MRSGQRQQTTRAIIVLSFLRMVVESVYPWLDWMACRRCAFHTYSWCPVGVVVNMSDRAKQ
eukprot:3066674-Alexandrium_andersonii.AAC.1